MSRERKDHTLQATALVNEAFLRFTDARQVLAGRGAFLGIAARLMRRLWSTTRERVALISARWSGTSDPRRCAAIAAELPLDVVELDRALEAFADVDARRSQVVELRFFGGLTVEETQKCFTCPLRPQARLAIGQDLATP